MLIKKQWISILIVGMTLGTAWAVRGQFGHEQGAAWAGATGALALVIVSKRPDWYAKMLTIALSSAVGWGAGGMISYGIVVGYGRSISYPNALYGLIMLFLIGGLFGLLGGGLTGLTLESSQTHKVKWGNLIAEMTAGGLILYYLLVGQLELLMTPPRSEAWAVCLGAGLAMLWYMARNKFRSAFRVALITELGGGFGFAFGNFLQTIGNIMEIKFNMWNVMEYSIGFFGGTSLAYGILSSKWPDVSSAPEKWENKAALIIVFIFIPFIVFSHSLGYNKFLGKFTDLVNPESSALISSLSAIAVIIVTAIITCLTLNNSKNGFLRKNVMIIFLTFFAAYITISYIVTGALTGTFLLNHHLYWLNFVIILLLALKQYPAFFDKPQDQLKGRKWLIWLAGLVILIALLASISANIHDEMPGSHNRFQL